MTDIHNYKKRLEQALRRLEKADISSANIGHIKGFSQNCIANGIGAGKAYRYVDDLVVTTKWLNKDLSKCNRRDIEALILKLEQSDYAEWTKYGIKICIRKFFKWLRDTEELPEEVRWIKLRMKNVSRRLPEDLITEEEAKKMILTAESRRDKAIIAVLYESGCRIQEVLTIRIKHIVFDEYGAVISVFGKTGSRRVRLVSAVPYLQEWINNHPENNNPEAFVWIKRGKRTDVLIGYGSARITLQRIAKRAGIRKKVNPHSFRHARASYLANYLTESQLKEVSGWAQASRMASVYVHLSGKNTDQAILKVYGKSMEVKTKKEVLTPLQCARCKTENEAIHKYCKLCGMALGEQEINQLIAGQSDKVEIDKIMGAILKDSRVLDTIAKKIKEINL
ncbi:MAG: tyrosine-type recombinase/integrase [Candidatus Pacearchaeota archaeon]